MFPLCFWEVDCIWEIKECDGRSFRGCTDYFNYRSRRILFGLFLIDMSVVKSETMRLADEAADVWKTDGKLADGTYKSQQLLLRNKNFLQKNRRGQLISKTRLRLQKRIATRLNIASLDSYKVSISGGKVLVQASVRLGNPLLGGRKYTGIKGWIFKCEEKADITNEEELLRKLSGNLR